MRTTGILLLLSLFLNCQQQMNTGHNTTTAAQKRYLALGDSYTVGESVARDDSFPYQLTRRLNAAGAGFAPPRVIARTGWTTDELQRAIEKEKPEGTFDLVTLLIGVNNQYRGYSINTYKAEFTALLDQAIAFAGGRTSSVIVVSIPDWGVTPFAASSGRDPAQISTEIDNYNALAAAACTKAGVLFTDITPHSRTAATKAGLLADDGLHPSALMYQHWSALLEKEISTKQ